MKRVAAVIVALALVGCGDGDDKAEKKIRDVTEDVRKGGSKAIDRAEEALKQLENSDLPEDARRELEEAKRLLDEQE